jgi:hypothetical protein
MPKKTGATKKVEIVISVSSKGDVEVTALEDKGVRDRQITSIIEDHGWCFDNDTPGCAVSTYTTTVTVTVPPCPSKIRPARVAATKPVAFSATAKEAKIRGKAKAAGKQRIGTRRAPRP